LSSPVTIVPKQLARLIGTPTSPVIVDVRIDEDFSAHPVFIPSAIRHSHKDMANLITRVAGRRAVVVCHKGLKLSEGVASLLRCAGVEAEVLEGGMVAWLEAKLPTVCSENIPIRQPEGHTLWVTRVRPKIDRIACPWLIKRFVDPDAQFMFVTASTVIDVADRFNATAFDMPEAHWSHRGDLCTFDFMLQQWKLDFAPLNRLATIVRGADTDRHDLAPESAGLLAASLGLSRMHRDDLAQLDAGLSLYDAFFRWARDAYNEQHDWPSGSAAHSATPATGSSA